MARTMVIVPRPQDSAYTHVPEFSRAAAERAEKEFERRGYAAILSGATGRPQTCRIADEPDAGAELVLYVWVQQVDLPRQEGADAPKAWGGIDLRDSRGRKLAANQGLLDSPGKPSNELFRVAKPGEPRAVEAADAFAAWMLAGMRRFSSEVDRLLGMDPPGRGREQGKS